MEKKKYSSNEAETKLVISLWQKYPCLYSKSSALFKDQNQREICRIGIAETLKEILKEEDSYVPQDGGNSFEIRMMTPGSLKLFE